MRHIFDLQAVEEFTKYLQSILLGKGYVEEQVFNADESGLFYKEVGKQTYFAHGSSADKNVTRGSQEPNLLFPLGAIV
jgi:hypothetical protein